MAADKQQLMGSLVLDCAHCLPLVPCLPRFAANASPTGCKDASVCLFHPLHADEPDYEVDDDPSQAMRLDVGGMPICVTVSLVGALLVHAAGVLLQLCCCCSAAAALLLLLCCCWLPARRQVGDTGMMAGARFPPPAR